MTLWTMYRSVLVHFAPLIQQTALHVNLYIQVLASIEYVEQPGKSHEGVVIMLKVTYRPPNRLVILKLLSLVDC